MAEAKDMATRQAIFYFGNTYSNYKTQLIQNYLFDYYKGAIFDRIYSLVLPVFFKVIEYAVSKKVNILVELVGRNSEQYSSVRNVANYNLVI